MVEAIRFAASSDAAALAALAERTFRATFAAGNSAEHMQRHCSHSYGAALQAAEIADPRLRTLLAHRGEALAGFAQLRLQGHAPACVGAGAAEIQRLYVDRPWHGQGVAPALMRVLLSLAAQERAARVWLGVWEHNPRAIAFYEKFGFRVVGEHDFDFGGDLQRDLVMQLQLPANQ
jgi:ribosomal protein S18 acetylase RimI-like enzyme